jgi:hypothetical protein
MARPPQPPSWRTRVAAVWCSDRAFRVGLLVLAWLVVMLFSLHT